MFVPSAHIVSVEMDNIDFTRAIGAAPGVHRISLDLVTARQPTAELTAERGEGASPELVALHAAIHAGQVRDGRTKSAIRAHCPNRSLLWQRFTRLIVSTLMDGEVISEKMNRAPGL
jgi:hypothetical protein